MMEATAILSRFHREAATELHAAMTSRTAVAIRSALDRVRHMAFDTKLEAEGQRTLEEVEEEERHSAQLDDARRKLSFTRRVCKPDDSTKLVAALEEAEKAGDEKQADQAEGPPPVQQPVEEDEEEFFSGDEGEQS